MPHPLAVSIEEETFHRKAPVRRRSSLDNSGLTAEGAVRERIASSQDPHEAEKTHLPRRPSLDDGRSVPITFLAGTGKPGRPKVDLDLDLHTSAHGRDKGAGRSPTPKLQSQSLLAPQTFSGGGGSDSEEDLLGADVVPTATTSDDKDLSPGAGLDNRNGRKDIDESGNDSSSSSGGGGSSDTFCDASVLEPADQEYIRRDLGASCYWSDGPDDLADADFQIDDDEVERHLVEIIADEGLEGDLEAADAAALAEIMKELRSS